MLLNKLITLIILRLVFTLVRGYMCVHVNDIHPSTLLSPDQFEFNTIVKSSLLCYELTKCVRVHIHTHFLIVYYMLTLIKTLMANFFCRNYEI